MTIQRHLRSTSPIGRLLPVLASLAVLAGTPTGGECAERQAVTPRTHVELVLPAGPDPAPVLSFTPDQPSPASFLDEGIFGSTQGQLCVRHNRRARLRLRNLWRTYYTLVRPTQTPRFLGILRRILYDDPPFYA